MLDNPDLMLEHKLRYYKHKAFPKVRVTSRDCAITADACFLHSSVQEIVPSIHVILSY
jgi:hypothetical protein